jgi:hypothetical protein
VYRVAVVGVAYCEFCFVRVDGTKPGEYNVWSIVKVVLNGEFDRYKEEQRVEEKRKQAQPAQTRRKSEDDSDQSRGQYLLFW